MAVRIDLETCMGCGACVPICPVEALSMNDDNKVVVDADTCIDCNACISECPVQAISEAE